ncbi:MAG: helix-turn-helix domain-containing protein [Promethearchaeota archaeon]|jgi:chromosomal replication initiation ATPase DnaA
MNYWSKPGITLIPKTADELSEQVCNKFGVSIDEVRSTNRQRKFTDARAIIAFILHKKMGMTTTETGLFINRDHSTVTYFYKKIEGWISIDKEYERLIKSFII